MPEGSESESEIFERLDVLSDLIEENIKLAHDTNRIVRDMRRTGRIAFWFKVILWIIVLGLPLLFIGPIMQYFTALTGYSIPAGTSAFGIPSSTQIQQAVTEFKAKNTATP
ncbi:MAG: hypothetical protein JWM39_445 [Parcubacteria group bacterium]|nr:hypothetical protein [Parcubacteria group bacterium]